MSDTCILDPNDFSFQPKILIDKNSQHQFFLIYLNLFLDGFFEARWIHDYQKENPDSELSLQADPQVRQMRDSIAKSAGKALQSLLSVLVAEKNQ